MRTETGQGNPSLLVGDPDFGPTESTAPATMASADPPSEADLLRNPLSGISDLRSFAALTFNSLPGTRDEVTAIAGLLVKDGKEPTLLTGAKATEAALKSAKHPRILHLATHGFFLPDTGMDEKMSDDDLRGVGGIRPMSLATSEGDTAAIGNPAGAKLWRQLRLKNPMHRSGVALAGANDTIRGGHAAGGDDGLLTAEEVAGMDLWGTRLVVISACESGVGEAKGGEGVFGLRRAFTMAGAQNLVMSLWSVSDKPTQALMTSLYENLDKTGSPPRALLAAQRDWIAKERAAGRYPHPFYWAAFVASGTGLSLESQ